VKILIVSFKFSPYNTSGAIRVDRFARGMLEKGHEVRVLTARNQLHQPSLESDFPENLVTRTTWFSLDRMVLRWSRQGGDFAASGREALRRNWLMSLAGRCRKWLEGVLFVPDAQIGWKDEAIREGQEIVNEWRPDVVFASGPPFTSLLVAEELARRNQLPWVAELRDLWAANPYWDTGWLGRFRNRRLERRCLRRADYLVASTRAAAEHLGQAYPVAAESIYTGFEGDASAGIGLGKRDENHRRQRPVSILHTGLIYPGKRDPGPLFEAMRLMREREKGQQLFRAEFVGRNLSWVRERARKSGVGDSVETFDLVSHAEAMELQRKADVLLLLSWDIPFERFVIPGKLFEYMGSGKPVLFIGPEFTESAKLIREHKLGWVCQNVDEVKCSLEEMANEEWESYAPENIDQYAISAQVDRLTDVLEKVANQERRTVRNGFGSDRTSPS